MRLSGGVDRGGQIALYMRASACCRATETSQKRINPAREAGPPPNDQVQSDVKAKSPRLGLDLSRSRQTWKGSPGPNLVQIASPTRVFSAPRLARDAFRDHGMEEVDRRPRLGPIFRDIGSDPRERAPAPDALALGAPAPPVAIFVAAGAAGATWATWRDGRRVLGGLRRGGPRPRVAAISLGRQPNPGRIVVGRLTSVKGLPPPGGRSSSRAGSKGGNQ
jgi:hypothetical protein